MPMFTDIENTDRIIIDAISFYLINQQAYNNQHKKALSYLQSRSIQKSKTKPNRKVINQTNIDLPPTTKTSTSPFTKVLIPKEAGLLSILSRPVSLFYDKEVASIIAPFLTSHPAFSKRHFPFITSYSLFHHELFPCTLSDFPLCESYLPSHLASLPVQQVEDGEMEVEVVEIDSSTDPLPQCSRRHTQPITSLADSRVTANHVWCYFHVDDPIT